MNDINQEMYALLTYLVSSAALLGQEPASYGPMRLIEAAKRLCSILVESGSSKSSELQELISLIENGSQSGISDEESFQQMLDSAVEKLLEIL